MPVLKKLASSEGALGSDRSSPLCCDSIGLRAPDDANVGSNLEAEQN